ncbi:MAG: hypothetical protein ACYTBJ_02710 [Planctomycetota bacterium]
MKVNNSLSPMSILMIVVALGIVARTVGPLLTEAGTQDRVCDLADGLGTLRAHLDLYRAHHNGSLPPTGSFSIFQSALTTEGGAYNPHIKRIPVNPFNGLATVRFDGQPAGSGKAGWRLNTKTGSFQADNSVEHAAL